MGESLSRGSSGVLPFGLGAARLSVLGVFFSAGFLFSSWAVRIPTVQSTLKLTPGHMGLLLLVGSAGSLIALPLAGRLVGRFGARATTLSSELLAAGALAAVAAAVSAGRPYLTGVALLVALAGVGAMDVAMNFEGASVERRLGRAIMPHFHGAFSLGTIAGAGLGTILSRAAVPITWHVWSVAAFVALTSICFTRGFLPRGHKGAGPEPEKSRDAARSHNYAGAWVEPRTLQVGLIVLAVTLVEGAANDWLALGVREGFGVAEHQGAFALTLFVSAMTIMRFAGTRLLDRFGRVRVLRASAGLAITGLAIFGLVPWLPLAMVGAVLWGLGAALGFPVGMSAASDEPEHAAARLSVVSTIGYGAFLIGPPLLGLLADQVGYRHALLALMVPLVLALAVMRRAAPPAPADAGE